MSPAISSQPRHFSSGKMSAKRSHPHLFAATLARSDSELDTQRRRGKRQRRDNSSMAVVDKCFELCPWQCQYENRHPANQEPRFATTSAQFDLFSKPGRSSPKKRRLQSLDSKVAKDCQNGYLTDLVHLRSSAFWELHQSITENGEGLVRRMREYERSRSGHGVHQKASDAEKRRCKRLSQRTTRTLVNTSDAADDEVILICSGESSNHIQGASFVGKRARALDTMDVDHHWSSLQHTRSSSPFSFPHTQYTTNSSAPQSDDGDIISFEDQHSFSGSPDKSIREPTPSLSNSACGSPQSTGLSLPLPSPTLSNTADDESSFSLPSTASEKILAALNLALANGAGSINDYSSVWNNDERFKTESYDSGDLWH